MATILNCHSLYLLWNQSHVRQHRKLSVSIIFHFYCLGIKFNLSYGSDAAEARMLSYKSSYIHIYSNSWGPDNAGFIVEGPRALTRFMFQTETARVSSDIKSLCS